MWPIRGDDVHLSQRFRAKDSDITFQSSDNFLFKVHKANIQTQSTGFTLLDQEFLTPNISEPIRLPEKGSTLELLFQFIYPEPHPDLVSVKFDTLDPLAHAAEKYKVFSAINICKIRMQSSVTHHPVELLAYAATRGYLDIAREAALNTLRQPDDVVAKLPPKIAVAWACYHEKWNQVLRAAFTYYRDRTIERPSRGKGGSQVALDNNPCRNCTGKRETDSCIVKVFLRLGGQGVSSLLDLSTTFAVECEWAETWVKTWHEFVEKRVRQIPQFDTFLL